jgi:hypothetical protein
VTGAWPWLAIASLGAYHGLDPSMGWLFAVALGLQEASLLRVLWALGPIALGHLISVAAVVMLISGASVVTAALSLRITGAGVLIGFGVFRLLKPGAHPRWVAMRVGFSELVLWSFLMASAHGAGLMLFPILMDMPETNLGMGHQMPMVGMAMPSILRAITVALVHTAAMLTVMGLVALIVYRWIGLTILRRAWINLDTIWAGALIAAGAIAFFI